jgi:prevent-host-death family protein
VRIGLREANQQFSKAIKAVKAGEEVVLTERGKPVAVIRLLEKSERGEPAVRHLEAAGLLQPASKRRPLPPCFPRPLKGPPLIQTLREERDES